MTTNKGFIVPLLLGLIALLVAGGGVYIYQNKEAKTPASIDTKVEQSIQTDQEENTVSSATSILNRKKTYTNTKQGYSFQYPEKLSLSTEGEAVNLSHSIPFENRDGGCDMKGDAELSKTLEDFGLSIKIVLGEVNPPYVDGTYSKGELKGEWAYMGAEGCGVTTYYFPISGNKTLLVTQNHLQLLSNNVTPDVKAKVLSVPGAISSEESEIILARILSTFKFTSTSNTYTYKNHGFTIELPKGFTPQENPSDAGPYKTISITLPSGHLLYVQDVANFEKYGSPEQTYTGEEKIGETVFKLYRTEEGRTVFWFQQGNVGYLFSSEEVGVVDYVLEELLKTFRFVGWAQ